MAKGLVLVVDDDETIRETLAELLTLEGYTTLAARDGLEGWEMIMGGGKLPDVILLDQMMPRMTGKEFLVSLSGRPDLASLPVVLISAAQDARAIAIEFGVGFARKPLDADLLLLEIARARG